MKNMNIGEKSQPKVAIQSYTLSEELPHLTNILEEFVTLPLSARESYGYSEVNVSFRRGGRAAGLALLKGLYSLSLIACTV